MFYFLIICIGSCSWLLVLPLLKYTPGEREKKKMNCVLTWSDLYRDVHHSRRRTSTRTFLYIYMHIEFVFQQYIHTRWQNHMPQRLTCFSGNAHSNEISMVFVMFCDAHKRAWKAITSSESMSYFFFFFISIVSFQSD